MWSYRNSDYPGTIIFYKQRIGGSLHLDESYHALALSHDLDLICTPTFTLRLYHLTPTTQSLSYNLNNFRSRPSCRAACTTAVHLRTTTIHVEADTEMNGTEGCTTTIRPRLTQGTTITAKVLPLANATSLLRMVNHKQEAHTTRMARLLIHPY